MKFKINRKLTYNVLTGLIMWCSVPIVLMAQIIPGNQSVKLSPYDLSSFAPENVFVHTDKPYYLTGETLWFKGYCFNQNTGRLSPLSTVLYVELFDQENQPVAQLKTSLKKGITNGQVRISSSWSTGTYFLRAYTAWMRNHGEEFFYYQPISVINPLSVFTQNMYKSDTSDLQPVPPNIQNNLIEISTDKELYTNRQLVEIKLIKSDHENFQHLDLSLSVYPYHRSLDQEAHISVMQGIPQVSAQPITAYFPETVGPIVYGDLGTAGIPGSNLMVSLGGKACRIYSPEYLNATRFALQLSKGVTYDDLYFWSTDHQKTQIALDSEFDSRPISKTSIPLTFDSSTIKFIESQSVNMQISNLYQKYINIHGEQTWSSKPQLPFFGHPEFRYDLDEYTRFPSLEEVFREYVRYAILRKRSGILKMFVWDHYSNHQSMANNVFFDQPAMVLLDGIPVGDLELLLDIDPLRIQLIEVVTKKYYVGNTVFHGVVSLTSYRQDFRGEESLFNTQKISRSSLHQPFDFYHPNYENDSENPRIPDRRNTLYWNPRVQLSSENPGHFQFYTGDANGDYQIVVNGFTSTGQQVHQTKRITINRSNTP